MKTGGGWSNHSFHSISFFRADLECSGPDLHDSHVDNADRCGHGIESQVQSLIMYGLYRPASRTTRKALSHHHHHHHQIVVKGIWTKVSDKARKKVYFADSTRVKKLTPTTRQPPTLHSDRILLDALPILYTNDSKAAAAWVNRNIPEDEPCVIGFDVEVSKSLLLSSSSSSSFPHAGYCPPPPPRSPER